MKSVPLKSSFSPEELMKYRGFNPQLFQDANLTDEETDIVLESLEVSEKKSEWGCFVVALIPIVYFIYWLFSKGNEMISGITGSSSSLNRFFLVGVAFILILLLKFILPLRVSPQAGTKMKKNWRKPIFFLRSFESDQQPEIEIQSPNLHLGKMAKHKFSGEVLINGYFSAYAPVVALCKPGEEKVYGVPNRIIVKHEDWKKLVQIWLKMSEYVVMLVPEKITDSLIWEFTMMKENKSLNEILFFIPEDVSQKGLERFIFTINKINQTKFEIDLFCANSFLVYNEEKKCFISMDYPKRYIKNLMKS